MKNRQHSIKIVAKRLVPTVDVLKFSRTGVVLQSVYLILHLTSSGYLVIAFLVVAELGLKTIILQQRILQFNSIIFSREFFLDDTDYIQRPPFLNIRNSNYHFFERLIGWVLFGELGPRLKKIKQNHPLGLVTGKMLIRISKRLTLDFNQVTQLELSTNISSQIMVSFNVALYTALYPRSSIGIGSRTNGSTRGTERSGNSFTHHWNLIKHELASSNRTQRDSSRSRTTNKWIQGVTKKKNLGLPMKLELQSRTKFHKHFFNVFQHFSKWAKVH